ncbi:hypothetical protein ACQPYE_27630 [Actinosynnema sp. CA-299493]
MGSIERADLVKDPTRPCGAGLARPLLEIAALLDPNDIPSPPSPPNPSWTTSPAGRSNPTTSTTD